jgi:simple sugar transport system permease protein
MIFAVTACKRLHLRFTCAKHKLLLSPPHRPQIKRSLFLNLRKVIVRPELGACLAAVAIFVLFAFVAGKQGFLSAQGTINYLEVSAQLGILATSVSLLMIAGEFDLSVGSMIGAAGVVIGIPVSQFGCPLGLAIIIAFFLSLLVGYTNGWLVVKTRLPSFIITLASLYVLRGLTIGSTLLFTNYTRVSGLRTYIPGDLLSSIFSGRPFGLPISIWWWILLTALLGWVLFKTPFGNWIFACGGDSSAARNVGVPVGRVKVSLFILTAVTATLLAVIQVLDTGSADVLRGEQKELEAIASAVIGGCLLTGGYGSVFGATIGALILGMVQQGIFYTGISTDWFGAVLGGMLLLAVLLNNYLRQRALRSN